jgi:PAS domain S-box-containing protein
MAQNRSTPSLKALERLQPGLVYLFNLKEKRFVYLNSQVKDMLGYTPAEILSLSTEGLRQLFHPDDVDFILLNRRKLENNDAEPFQAFQYRIRDRNGGWHWLACRETFQYNQHGDNLIVLGLAQDITPEVEATPENEPAAGTESDSGSLSSQASLSHLSTAAPEPQNADILDDRLAVKEAPRKTGHATLEDLEQRIKERTKALQQTEGALRAFMDAIPETAFLIEPGGNILSANSTFAQRLDLPVDDLPGRNVYDLIDQDTSAAMRSYSQYVLHAGVPARFSNQRGERIIDNFVYPVFDGDGRVIGLAVMGFDITERKLAEEALAQQARELARSNAELEQFAYIASHDLQEPLRMVAGFTQLLSERYKGQLDDKADQYIDFAVEGASYMQNLIEDLLSYSRVTTRAKPFQPTNFQTVLQKTLSNLRVTINENQAEITSDPLPTLLADESQMIQLFQNLVGNAIKFHADTPPHVHISAREEDKEWIFSVKDNGIGINPRYYERIFVIFQRLHSKHSSYPGTGIGLAICKKVVERHGGRIWVESEPGKGTTFYFSLPAYR